MVPCQALIELIVPHDPKTKKKGGRPPYPLMTMLGIYLLQQWCSLGYPAMEEALIAVPTMSRFASIDMISEWIPDETTILSFRMGWAAYLSLSVIIALSAMIVMPQFALFFADCAGFGVEMVKVMDPDNALDIAS